MESLTSPVLWIPIAANVLWAVVNGLWSVFNVRMENRLMREYVSNARCKELNDETNRRLAQIGA